MTLRCAVLDDYQDVALTASDWSVLGDDVAVTVFRDNLGTEADVAAALADYDAVVLMRERTPFPRALFARLPRLRLLITTAMRNASIDLDAAAEHGVMVCGTGSIENHTVELTWALILGLARHLVVEHASVRSGGRWQSTVGTDLSGSTLGVLGLGRLGTKVAGIGQAFGMHVVAWSQNLTAERAADVGVALAPTKAALFAESDIISIHLVLSERTRGAVGAGELAAMRRSALLVNTSRGPIVDRDALLTALREERIGGAALDVFDREPLPSDDELRRAPRLLTTPHIGYVTRGNYSRYFSDVVGDLAAYIAGEPVRRLV